MTRQGTIQVILLTAVGAVLLHLGYTVPGTILCVLAGLQVALAIVAPAASQTLQELGARLGRRVGTVLGVIMLTLVYYSVFLGGGLWLRIRRIDPLKRRFPTHSRSNWVDRVGFGADPTLYGKQYTRPHGRGEARRSSG